MLVAEGYAENISPTNGVINNAPSTPNDSFTVVDDDEDDTDDCEFTFFYSEILNVNNINIRFILMIWAVF